MASLGHIIAAVNTIDPIFGSGGIFEHAVEVDPGISFLEKMFTGQAHGSL